MPSQSVLGLGARAFRGYTVLDAPLFPARLYVDASDPASYGGSGTVWYDVSGNNREVALPTTLLPGPATGRYVRWISTATKGGCSNGCTSIAELVLYNNGTPVTWNTGATVTNPGGSDGGYPQHRPYALIDRNRAPDGNPTWYGDGFINFASGPTTLIIDNRTPITFTHYAYATRWDSESTDPISWTLAVSNDGVTWTTVSTVTNATIPSARSTLTQQFPVQGQAVGDFTYDPSGFFTFNASPATIAMPLDAGYTRYPYNPARWYYSLWVRVAGVSSSARELLLIEEQNIIPVYGNRFQLRLAIPANSLVPTFSQYIWPDQIVPTTSLNHVMSANTWTHFFIETHLASAAFTATLRSIRVFVDNVLQYNRGPANLNGGDFDLNPGILRLGAGVSVANFRFMTVDAPNGDSTGMSDVQRTAIYTRTAPTAP